MAIEEAPTAAQLIESLHSACTVAERATPEERTLLMNVAHGFVVSTQPFRFLDLPPELRNRIYDDLVVMELPLLPGACQHTSSPTAAQPNITRVCRQIRHEALPMFYGLNQFDAHIHRCDFAYFIDYMEAIGEHNRKHIKNVVLKLMDRLRCGNGL